MMNLKFFKKLSYLAGFVFIVFIACLVFLSFQYKSVSKAVSRADKLVSSQEYQQALDVLEESKSVWVVENLSILDGRIEDKIMEVSKLQEDRSEHELGKAYLGNENWEKAREFFLKVSSSSPFFDEAEKKLDRVETEVIVQKAVDRLREEVQEVRREAKQAREEDDISIAVARWSNFVIPVRCHWTFLDGELKVDKKGSGTIMVSKDGLVEVLTNRHVVTYEDYLPDRCEVRFPDSSEMIDLSEYDSAYYLSKKEEDWATINISSLPSEVYDKVDSYISTFDPLNNVCEVEVQSGDKVVVLGYPKIGPRDKITATTGIVSGQEDRFYVTDAKIDEGNSGGVAVLLRRNCFLGIPTSVEKGSAESLGRILDAEIILDETRDN